MWAFGIVALPHNIILMMMMIILIIIIIIIIIYIFRTVHLCVILVGKKLDAQFLL